MQALEDANVGVALISKDFIGKPWPMHELREIVRQPGKALPVLYLMDDVEFKRRAADHSEVIFLSYSVVIWHHGLLSVKP